MPKFGHEFLLAAGFAIRLIFIFYGEWQDRNFELKYTDIDYKVFSDATFHIANPTGNDTAQGWLGSQLSIGSPYTRETYRYTPLLAVFLLPNQFLHPAFGKVLFSACDIIISVLIDRILWLQNVSVRRRTWLVCLVWLFNPMTINIATRGSAEAVLGCMVLASLHAFLVGRRILLGLLLGLAVHFKVYPIIYVPTVIFGLIGQQPSLRQYIKALFSKRMLEFAFAAAASFSMLAFVMHALWGWPFLEHTYLYHIHRLDHRHNFSPVFYTIALSGRNISPLASFVPQLLVTFLTGLAYARQDQSVAWFLQTMVFVTFNKVCTSQYFLWYLWLLPFLIVKSRMGPREAAVLVSLWVLGQAIWLKFAYSLEMLGQPKQKQVWTASLAFQIVNGVIIGRIIDTTY